MPAIETGGAKVKRGKPLAHPKVTPSAPKPGKVIYGPPAPKAKPKVIYGPPAPRPRMRRPTPAERTANRSRTRVRAIRAEVERKTPDVQSEAAVERFKQSQAYINTVQAARATQAQRLRKDIFHGYAKETAAEAQAREDRPHVSKHFTRQTEPKPTTGPPSPKPPAKQPPAPKTDQPRTDRELREFLRSGRRPIEAKPGQIMKAEQAVKLAPVTKIIDLTARGTYAEAGAASAALKGESPAKVAHAAVRGLKGKERKTFSTVLREHHVPGAIAAPVGLTADIVFDPTTYTSFGLGPVSRKLVQKAAADAAKKAAEGGASLAAAKEVGEREAKRAAERARGGGASAPSLTERASARAAEQARAAAPKGKGVVVKFAGREVPGVTRGTAAVGRSGKRIARKVTPKATHAVPGKLRTGLHKTFRPSARPGDVSAETFTATRQAARRSRAHVKNEEARALTLARELKAKLPAEHYAAVIDALERGRLGRLPASIRNDAVKRGAVHDLRSALAGAYREGRRTNAIKGSIGDYSREFLTNAHQSRLASTVRSEVKAQGRNVDRLKRAERDAAAQAAVAHEAAKGSAERVAAVATEKARGGARQRVAVETQRVRGQAAVETEKARRKVAVANEQAKRQAAVANERATAAARAQATAGTHANRVSFERALADARVSVAKPKTSDALKGHLRTISDAQVARDAASTKLKRAKDALKREQSKPVLRQRGVAVLHARVRAAEHQLGEARRAVPRARQAAAAERKRIKGVAPAEHNALLDAAERGKVKPAPVERSIPQLAPKPARVKAVTPAMTEKALRAGERAAVERAPAILRPLRESEGKAARGARSPNLRVEPAAPGGARLAKAQAGHRLTVTEHEAGQARHAAAKAIPTRSLHETHAQYLQRVIDHATTHNLPLVKSRAEKLLAARPTDAAKGYFPRDFNDRIAKQLGVKPEDIAGHAYAKTGIGYKVSRITPGFKRAEQRRMGPVNKAREAAGQVPFSTDIPLVALNHLKSVARAVSQGKFHQELADLGRPLKVTRGADGKVVQPALKDSESIYRLGTKDGQFGLHEVDAIPSSFGKAGAGQYVALDKQLADEFLGAMKQISDPHFLLSGFDRTTGVLKRIMTTTLGFHLRNMVSDLGQSYLETPGHRLAGNVKSAATATRRAHGQARVWRPTTSTKTIKVAGKDEPLDDFLKGARQEGVLDAGYIGRELSDLSGEGAARVSKVPGSSRIKAIGQKADRVMTSRENLMRLATYKAGLDRGLGKADAADVANKIHVDYNDLTDLERKFMRRVFPFYTWTARSLPLAVETLIKTPGKYATIEKIRQEIGQATTGQTEDQQRAGMTNAVQRGYPVVIGKHTVGLGLPQTLLNEAPSGISPGAYVKELDRFAAGMANQLLRAPAEASFNRNAVTKADIEAQRGKQLVAAPSWVSHLPNSIKRTLNVQAPKGKGGIGYVDPKTGRPSWAWRGRADWTYDQLMLGFVGQLAAIAGSGRSQTTPGQTAGSIVGLKLDPLNKVMQQKAEQQASQPERDRVAKRLQTLNELGITADNATPEYKALRAKVNAWEKAKPGAKKTKKAPTDILGGSSASKVDILGGGAHTVDILK